MSTNDRVSMRVGPLEVRVTGAGPSAGVQATATG